MTHVRPSRPRRCAWRGLLLDEARHFFGKNAVKALLERMAENGLNVFHWHLTDDQGWRLDLPGMPELVRFGAARASSPRPGDPYRYRAWVLENGWTLPADRVRAFDPFSFVPPDLAGRVLGGECCAWSESIHDRAELEYKVLGRLAAFGEALNRG